jgi:ribosomal protein L11 methylase PrmA
MTWWNDIIIIVLFSGFLITTNLSLRQEQVPIHINKMISKLFLVQVDATEASATTRWRQKYDGNQLPTIDIFLADLQIHLCQHSFCEVEPTNLSDIHVEEYDPIQSLFIPIETIDQLHELLTNGRQATQILVKNVHRLNSLQTETFMIRGRAFDTSHGLTITSSWPLKASNSDDTKSKSMRGDRTLLIAEPGEAHLGTGLNTWDGSIVLAKYLQRHQDSIIHGKRVLEVGAGTGIAGMAAAWLGAAHTVLTDLPYVLQNLQNNILHNFDATSLVTEDTCMREEKDIEISAEGLDWMDDRSYPIYHGQQWDVILGADVVWIESLIPSLVQTLTACANENSIVLISHQVTQNILFGEINEIFLMD